MELVTIISELTKAKSPLILLADLAAERKRQLTTRANQTTGLTNGRVQIGHRKSRFRAFPFRC